MSLSAQITWIPSVVISEKRQKKTGMRAKERLEVEAMHRKHGRFVDACGFLTRYGANHDPVLIDTYFVYFQ